MGHPLHFCVFFRLCHKYFDGFFWLKFINCSQFNLIINTTLQYTYYISNEWMADVPRNYAVAISSICFGGCVEIAT